LQHVFKIRAGYTDAADGIDLPLVDQHTRSSDDYLLQNSISVSGALHMLHSIVKYLTDELPNFHSFFWAPFKSLVDFLRRRECRKLLVQKCFNKHPADSLQYLFNHFTATLKD